MNTTQEQKNIVAISEEEYSEVISDDLLAQMYAYDFEVYNDTTKANDSGGCNTLPVLHKKYDNSLGENNKEIFQKVSSDNIMTSKVENTLYCDER